MDLENLSLVKGLPRLLITKKQELPNIKKIILNSPPAQPPSKHLLFHRLQDIHAIKTSQKTH